MPPKPGINPSLSSGKQKRAILSAIIKSQASASSNPPPNVTPCTAAIVDRGEASIRFSTRWMPSRKSPTPFAPPADSIAFSRLYSSLNPPSAHIPRPDASSSRASRVPFPPTPPRPGGAQVSTHNIHPRLNFFPCHRPGHDGRQESVHVAPHLHLLRLRQSVGNGALNRFRRNLVPRP